MTNDPVNHPDHYTTGGIEAIDFIEAKELGFHIGNAVKYLARAQLKGKPVQDVQKAIWYLQRWIDNQNKEIEVPAKPAAPVNTIYGDNNIEKRIR